MTDILAFSLEQAYKSLIDLTPLEVIPKVVAPLEEQHELETRRVWESVTNFLNAKEFSSATKAKQSLEEAQRVKAAERKATGDV